MPALDINEEIPKKECTQTSREINDASTYIHSKSDMSLNNLQTQNQRRKRTQVLKICDCEFHLFKRNKLLDIICSMRTLRLGCCCCIICSMRKTSLGRFFFLFK